MILIQDRDHPQKSINTTLTLLVQFQKLFKVLDAHRVSKRGMGEMMTSDRIDEWIQDFALYRLDIQ
jgi:hypothetical protein